MSHSEQAALRGEPSYVWRAGQERRLQMMARWAQLNDARVLVAGCGVGMYAGQIRQRYTPDVDAFDIEVQRARSASQSRIRAFAAAGEHIPCASGSYDTVLSHEVLEHVADDRRAFQEMLRVTKVGGHILLFCPNRWYPFETHGHYWRGEYHFGNTPLINYLPNRLRDLLAPHVRAYTNGDIQRLVDDERASILHQERIYGGYDNIIARLGSPARWLRDLLQRCEGTLLDTWALSHFVVVQKHSDAK